MFQEVLTGYAMKSSMSRRGNCWDNAPTESLWGRLKVGRLHGRKFATRREAMDEVMDWLTFYNHKRLHSTLGYVSPMTFEQRWHAALRQVKNPHNGWPMESGKQGQGHYMMAINARCLDDVDLSPIKVGHFDGLSL